MKHLKEFAIYRGIPLVVGYLTVRYWGDDATNRQVVVFCLAMFVAHSLLSMFDIGRTLASAIDKLSDEVAVRSRRDSP